MSIYKGQASGCQNINVSSQCQITCCCYLRHRVSGTIVFGLKCVLHRVRVSRCHPSRAIQNPAEQLPGPLPYSFILSMPNQRFYESVICNLSHSWHSANFALSLSHLIKCVISLLHRLTCKVKVTLYPAWLDLTKQLCIQKAPVMSLEIKQSIKLVNAWEKILRPWMTGTWKINSCNFS